MKTTRRGFFGIFGVAAAAPMVKSKQEDDKIEFVFDEPNAVATTWVTATTVLHEWGAEPWSDGDET